MDRSISYIFLRDLGKRLDSPDTESKVRHIVERLKNHLTTNREEDAIGFSLAALYRWAKKEGLESTIIWLIEKLGAVSAKIPPGLDAEHAQRKLMKIIAGVMMHVLDDMGQNIPGQERTQKLDEAIRLGYSYGLTYPFIDDLLASWEIIITSFDILKKY